MGGESMSSPVLSIATTDGIRCVQKKQQPKNLLDDLIQDNIDSGRRWVGGGRRRRGCVFY